MTDMERLQYQTRAELEDEEFTNRKHYSRSTYKDGCHGPLCLKAERDKAARRYKARKPDKDTKERTAWQIARDNYLEGVIEQHGLRSEAQARTMELAEVS